MAVACALLVPAPLALARARESLAIATPFEVGDSPIGNYLAAYVAGIDKDTLAAATYFREALRYDPHNSALIERAFVAAISNGNMQDAFGFADRLLARDPGNGLAHLALGVKAIKQHQYAAARNHFARGGAGHERDITATLLAAWTYAGSGEYKRGLELVDRLHDESFGVFRDFHGGLIADVAHNPTEAARRLKASYDTDKNTLRLVDVYARFLALHGRRDEAIKVYEAFDEILPNHPIISAALATLKSGKTLESPVRTPEEGAAEVLYGLGAAGSRQGDELAAMIYLRLSLFLAPENSLAIITLGDIYERIKQNERAIDVYETVPDDDPLRITADIQSGQILEALGRTEEANKYLKRIVEEHPKDSDALSALGNLQRAHKQYAEAIETYTQALAATSKPEKANWPLYYFRGISYERNKQWPQAEADFRRALALFPDQPLVLNYLGYSWVDQGLNLDEAFAMLHKAVELRPTDGYIVDSLGWANYRLGRYDEAVKELERAIDLKPSDPVINDHLGDAYWRVGRKLEAHFQWNHARDLGPEPEDKDKILAKIEHGLDDEEKPAAAEARPAKNGG
ncbi:tetratricopeptide repeat protein [Beijerinckia indica]|uniref:Tetratricopeptide TPR_2 repeat protein n=1 Tax=Beijerinckia indica subsp. indica (strain ATCC 9039 / DSM 1715 / NCIMB 8712) TaxID=395963 RepID=B2IHI6_BEII9|nr:tetratricopeptide repeat protein [Beijerinckia indica]ACB94507.1 Tetratricopeptide TPR_2 repeat protein [Beijerinckia indica subsp. indica ATCC 9039]